MQHTLERKTKSHFRKELITKSGKGAALQQKVGKHSELP